MFIVIVFLPVFSSSSLCTALGWIVLGCKSLFEVGGRIFVLRPMSHLAGEPRASDTGIFLYSKSAK